MPSQTGDEISQMCVVSLEQPKKEATMAASTKNQPWSSGITRFRCEVLRRKNLISVSETTFPVYASSSSKQLLVSLTASSFFIDKPASLECLPSLNNSVSDGTRGLPQFSLSLNSKDQVLGLKKKKKVKQ